MPGAKYTGQISRTQIIAELKRYDGAIQPAAYDLGIARTTLRDWIKSDKELSKKLDELRSSAKVKPVKQKPLPLELAKPDTTLKLQKAKRQTFVVTCAQNNTKLHAKFVQNLFTLVERKHAQFVVIPNRYKNPTAYLNKNDIEIEWPKELNPYYLNDEFHVNENLVILGNLKIQATAINPLEGIHDIVANKSAVIGHPNLEVKMLANSHEDISRMLTTTGSCSVANYSSSKVGYKAEMNHKLGALIIEVEGDKFFIRQVEGEADGSFYDLDSYYLNGSYSTGHRAAALSCGDIHCDFVDPDVVKATFTSKDSIMNICKPKNVMLPDIFDNGSVSHHDRSNIGKKYKKFVTGRNSVQKECDRVAEFLNNYCTGSDTNYFIIASNHNDGLGRWWNESDPKFDPENALFYHQLSVYMLTEIKKGNSPNPLKFAIQDKIKNKDNIFFWGRNKKLVVAKHDHSQHSDRGVNGSKGSLNGFAKLGLNLVIDHSHTPGRKGKTIQSGTSSQMDLGYNAGYSSWLHCHVLEYSNGAVTLLPIIKGGWHAGS